MTVLSTTRCINCDSIPCRSCGGAGAFHGLPAVGSFPGGPAACGCCDAGRLTIQITDATDDWGDASPTPAKRRYRSKKPWPCCLHLFVGTDGSTSNCGRPKNHLGPCAGENRDGTFWHGWRPDQKAAIAFRSVFA